ncbi:MAG: hypothetical protein ACK56P_02925 [Chitinophagales bacterium]
MFCSFLIIFLFSSCVRDLTCDCYKKKGARVLVAIITNSHQHSYIAEKRRYYPSLDYDKDTGYKAIVREMKIKFDSIHKNNQTTVFIGVQDSFVLDTIRIKGFELDKYRRAGYTYKCWE